jgi:hypothetical protein
MTSKKLLILRILSSYSKVLRSCDSSVGTETSLYAGRPENWGSIPGRGKVLSLLYNARAVSGAHLASYTMGIGGRLGRVADHSLEIYY